MSPALAAGRAWVLDTNVLISAALIAGSAPDQLLKRVLSNEKLVVSTTTVAEARTRLAKPKFDRYLSAESREAFLSNLLATALPQEPSSKTLPALSRDLDDNAFLSLAMHLASSKQQVILVSGDQDLLVLAPIYAEHRIEICTVAQALMLF